MKQSKTLISYILTLLVLCFSYRCQNPISEPNILIVLTDDQAWGDLSFHNNPWLETPNIEVLAKSGARVSHFYVSPVCAPTRASLLTGLYHQRLGVSGVTRGLEVMSSEFSTLADVLVKNNYKTGLFGKWHNGSHGKYHPNNRGFQHFIGFCAGHWSNYFNATLENNKDKFQSEGFLPDYLTQQAIEFANNEDGKPFFAFLSLPTPHTPYQVPDLYFDKYKSLGLSDTLSCLYGMIENIDQNLKKITDHLENNQLSQNTILIFTSDNGPNLPRYNQGLKGVKGSVNEGGIRVPFFIKWDKIIPHNSIVDGPMAHIDLMPTLINLAEIECDLKFDGIDWSEVLLGNQSKVSERDLFMEWHGNKRVLSKNLLMINHELFDLANDPIQQTDLANTSPELFEEQQKKYEQWKKQFGQYNQFFNIPISSKYSMMSILQAHEGTLNPITPFGQDRTHTGISYVTKWGWANDYVSNWNSTNTSIEWKVDVEQKVSVSFFLNYTCPSQSIGTIIKLSTDQGILSSEITESFDPPFNPSPDRVERKAEVYDKNWKELYLGELELNTGIQSIKVSLESLPDESSIDLKEVILKYK